jgi:glutathione reductase (NADPH)
MTTESFDTAETFDLVVLGAGTGANSVARACAKAGWSVAIVDCLPYGGTCALRGCDPKKMLVGVTEALDWGRRMAGKGLRATDASIDWPEMMAFKRTFTDAVPASLEAGFEKLGIETLHGTATFVSPHEVKVGDRVLDAKHIHVATGARPRTLGIPGEELVASSTDFLELETLPPRIVFVGGGFISFEFAHIARRAGTAEVTIIHRSARPLVHFDPDLVALQVERTRQLGIDVRLESCVIGISANGDSRSVIVEEPGGESTIECDMVVHGAGRVPELDGLNLEAAGVEVTPYGIAVSTAMRSVSNPRVFAAGDCADTGAPNLTPVSANEARVAFKNLIAGEDVRHIEYPPIPTTVFTVPPIAAVGLLEEEARAEGIEVDVRYRETGRWYSSVRVGEEHTAFKVLIDKATGSIVGAHVMGPGAEEQINLFAMAMGAGVTANQLKAMIFAYPSYASDLASMV